MTYRVNVRDRLVKGTNELVITFPSTFLKVGASSTELSSVRYGISCAEFSIRLQGKDLEKKDSKYECWNGDPSRLHVRKAQYK